MSLHGHLYTRRTTRRVTDGIQFEHELPSSWCCLFPHLSPSGNFNKIALFSNTLKFFSDSICHVPSTLRAGMSFTFSCLRTHLFLSPANYCTLQAQLIYLISKWHSSIQLHNTRSTAPKNARLYKYITFAFENTPEISPSWNLQRCLYGVKLIFQ